MIGDLGFRARLLHRYIELQLEIRSANTLLIPTSLAPYMKRYLFALTPFCLVVSTLAAGNESVVYDGTTYVIPVPSGFVRYDQSFPQLAEPTKRAIASFNDLLSAYARQDDLAA